VERSLEFAESFSIRGFMAPGRYIQGRGVLSHLGKLVRRFGRKALLLADDVVWRIVKGVVTRSLSDHGIEYIYVNFRGECSYEEIRRVAKNALDNHVDMVIGLGGGKAIDTTKAVAIPNDIVTVTVPTIASTDAPTSSISIIYSEDPPNRMIDIMVHPRNPDMVIVDTDVMVKAPPRYLASGMGDASSHYWETKTILQGVKGGFNFVFMDVEAGKGRDPLKPFELGHIFAKRAWEILQAHGVSALEANRVKSVTPSFELVVYANTLLSGLAFENGGTALAHALAGMGFATLEDKMRPPPTHGELVAFSTLVELVAEADMHTIKEYVRWAHSVGLPQTLKELNLTEISDEDIYRVAERTLRSFEIQYIPYELSVETLVDLIKYADHIGNVISQTCPRASYD